MRSKMTRPRRGRSNRACEKAREDFAARALALSTKRRKAARALDKEVADELPPLKLEKAQFETRVEALEMESAGARGLDRVEFMVAANPGSAAGPLMKGRVRR